MPVNRTTLMMHVFSDTEAAVLAGINGSRLQARWLPKRHLKITPDPDRPNTRWALVDLPTWLAEDRGFTASKETIA